MKFTNSDPDVARPLPEGSFIYSGFANDNIELIKEWQLKDRSLWASLVDQFRNGLDNEKRRWRCEYWGKLMRGAAMTYLYTLDDELYAILEETVEDLLSTQDELGRITSYDAEHEFSGWDIWGRKYVLLGLRHFIEISKSSELNDRIISAMKAEADYIIEKVGGGISQIPIDDTSTYWLAMNSHSILEPMVCLYNITGEQRYLDFSAYIVDNGGVAGEGNNIFELAYENDKAPFQYPASKAYEMMSCFEGLLEYARVTGEEKWKTAVINFANRLYETDITIIGCAGCTHEQLDNATVKQTDDTYKGLMQETCVTVTWMKLCYQLLRLTGESKYAEWIETASYNALLGAVNTERRTTNLGFHFDSYSPLMLNTRGRAAGGLMPLDCPEASEYLEGTRFFGCCTAIAAAGLALMPLYSVMKTDNGIQINEYFCGSFNYTSKNGDQVMIRTETDYPYDGYIKMTVNAEPSEDGDADEYEIKLRLPSYSKNTVVKINGIQRKTDPDSGFFAETAVWKNGDVIEIEADVRPRAICPFGEYGKGRYLAIKAGAIVLARDARLGGDISKPVSISAGSDGLVENIVLSEADAFDNRICYELDGGGEKIKLVDYAAAGKTWDEESLMTAWLPIDN